MFVVNNYINVGVVMKPRSGKNEFVIRSNKCDKICRTYVQRYNSTVTHGWDGWLVGWLVDWLAGWFAYRLYLLFEDEPLDFYKK
jgi:hypothetical protein